MAEAEIKEVYDVDDVHEIRVDFNGIDYLILYGQHINGWFISILNRGISTEAEHPADILYNKKKLESALGCSDAAFAIVKEICRHYISEQYKSRHQEGLNND